MCMTEDHFRCQCVCETQYGVQEGLIQYSQQPTRVALIYAVKPGDPIRVYDPLGLLHGHEPKFKELFLENDHWRRKTSAVSRLHNGRELSVDDNLDLTGLVSWGGRSLPIFYQVWFTEHHADMCHVGPTRRWLEQAAYRLSHAFANPQRAYTGISGQFLREYATHAVRDYIVDQMNLHLGMDTGLRVYPILYSILDISRTREEGVWPRGELLFVDPSTVETVPYVARFPVHEQPLLVNHKHMCKLLLASEGSNRKLVSDGQVVLGIAADKLPPFRLIAEFRGGHGFVHINDDLLCSFYDGSFHSSTMKANMVQLEESLLELDLEPRAGAKLFRVVSDIVHLAQRKKHGCSLVLDFNEQPEEISGQDLEWSLDLQDPTMLELAQSLAKVDGALHLGADLQLRRFACLLDGPSTGTEDRARGARFNSAIRFTADRPHVIVVVVSSDRKVSVIQEGVEINAQCQWAPVSVCPTLPPTIEEWLAMQS